MSTAAILGPMAAAADATRARILRLLGRHELTVSELCAILQLPQSTTSRHLRVLQEEGWIVARRHGTSRIYRMPREQFPPDLRGLWDAVEPSVSRGAAAAEDDRRLEEVLAARRLRSRDFFAGTAGRWDRLRDGLFGPAFHLRALPALLDPGWTVGDLGCGSGQVSEALAPFVRRVIAVDGSREMLQTAAVRLDGRTNVEFRAAELDALPVDDGELDAAVLILVLGYLPEPRAVLREARRALRAGGPLLIVDLQPHEREEIRHELGQLWTGFEPESVRALLANAGFDGVRLHPLPTPSEARGPALFVAAARAVDPH